MVDFGGANEELVERPAVGGSLGEIDGVKARWMTTRAN